MSLIIHEMTQSSMSSIIQDYVGRNRFSDLRLSMYVPKAGDFPCLKGKGAEIKHFCCGSSSHFFDINGWGGWGSQADQVLVAVGCDNGSNLGWASGLLHSATTCARTVWEMHPGILPIEHSLAPSLWFWADVVSSHHQAALCLAFGLNQSIYQPMFWPLL